mgnify:CR=1 FL=1
MTGYRLVFNGAQHISYYTADPTMPWSWNIEQSASYVLRNVPEQIALFRGASDPRYVVVDDTELAVLILSRQA